MREHDGRSNVFYDLISKDILHAFYNILLNFKTLRRLAVFAFALRVHLSMKESPN